MDDIELKKMVGEIHTAILGSMCGTPGLIERTRSLEQFKAKIEKTIGTIIGFLAVNVGTIVTAIIIFYLKLR